MEINRRTFLGTSFSAPLLLSPSLAWTKGRAAYVTTGRSSDQSFSAFIVDRSGEILARVPLIGRGHGIAINPVTKSPIIFARRPGRYALALDMQNRTQSVSFSPPKTRHFYGHGVFSNDGRYLFATENDFGNDVGFLGIYDSKDHFRRVAEFETGGIGPHEVLLSQDGKTLIVANGGIATHPDYPRQKLNLADMKPCVSFINVRNGDILKTLRLPKELHQVSLRHMAKDTLGNFWIGGQYHGPKTDRVPVLFKISQADTALMALPNQLKTGSNFKQYIGAVAVNSDGSKVAFSAPRGNLISIWNCASDTEIQRLIQQDACGIAPRDQDFLITTGQGIIRTNARRLKSQKVTWDNHITAL